MHPGVKLASYLCFPFNRDIKRKTYVFYLVLAY